MVKISERSSQPLDRTAHELMNLLPTPGNAAAGTPVSRA